jgi:hypothetical protein
MPNEKPIVAIVRAAVTDIEPSQADRFDFVAESFARNPAAARRAGKRRDEPTSAGWDVAVQGLIAVACAVGVEICKEMVLSGARTAGGKLRRLFSGKPKVDLNTVPPPIPVDEKPEFISRAVAIAKENGVADEVATRIAKSLADQWPTRQ